MKLAFQDTAIELGELQKIADALDILEHPKHPFGVILFCNEITGEPFTEPTIMFGGTKCVKLLLKGHLPENGIIFYDKQKFDQAYYGPILGSDMLNDGALFMTYGVVKDQIPSVRWFVKPSCDLKYFAGCIIEPSGNSFGSELERTAMIDADLDDDIMILLNNHIREDIVCEYRVFVVNYQIIDICQYMKNGKVEPMVLEPFSYNRVYAYVTQIQRLYNPHSNYVIDITRLNSGKLKVVEYNCINCSGMYAIDRVKVYKALIDL